MIPCNDTLYTEGRTRYFTQVFPTVDDFESFYSTCGIPPLFRNKGSISTLYYLLCSYYANSRIASSDESRFKYNVMSIIFQYGPTWEKNLDIQAYLREIDITAEEWLDGAKSAYNISLNPATDPAADTFQTLETINQQNQNIHRKGKLEGLSILSALLETDVTGAFLTKFKKLFRKITYTSRPLLYETYEMEDSTDD